MMRQRLYAPAVLSGHTSLFLSCVVVASFAVAGPAQAGPATTQSPVEGVPQNIRARFAAAAAAACSERGVPKFCRLTDVTREVVLGDVARYTATFAVGPGPYDVIVISRVVRERSPGVPVHTLTSVMLLNGSGSRFLDQFVKRSRLPDDPGLAVWLAHRDLDVWGFDLRYGLVPATTSQFDFMAAWDFQTDVTDAMLASRFARHVRRLTGQRFARLHMLGFSNGGALAYAAANAEAVLPERERDIETLIPIEAAYKLGPTHETQRQNICTREATQANLIARGDYAVDITGVIRAGELAQEDPEGASPSKAGFTNRQYALFQACATTAVSIPRHNFACVFDGTIPREPMFTRSEIIFETQAHNVAFRNRSGIRDYWALLCGQTDVPWDNHLADIRVPVLAVAAAGGFGTMALDTLSLLGSTDISSFVVQFLPQGHEPEDFGHSEPIFADVAEDLVWTVVLDWILEYSTSEPSSSNASRR